MKNTIDPTIIPARQTTHSAGYDFYAVEDMVIPTTHYRVFDTGVCFNDETIIGTSLFEPEISDHEVKDLHRYNMIFQQYVAFILPRSSYGFKYGMHFSNTMCVIDQDYRDTIKISVKSDIPLTIKKGERYAQLIFLPIGMMVGEKKPTVKRSGGVGSTDDKPKTTLEDFE